MLVFLNLYLQKMILNILPLLFLHMLETWRF